MDETLSQYNSWRKKSVKVLNAIEEDDFSSLDYESIKHTEFFKSLGLTTLQDYIKGKNLSDSESKNLCSKFYYLIKKIVIKALKKKHKEEDLFWKSRHVINFQRIINVKLFTVDYLKKLESDIEEVEKRRRVIKEKRNKKSPN